VSPSIDGDGQDVLPGVEPPRPEHELQLGADLALVLRERLVLDLAASHLHLLGGR
jgi:hypothetical protein